MRPKFHSQVREIPWRRAWQPTLVFLLGESHVQRSLVSFSPWGCKKSDRTEQLTHLIEPRAEGEVMWSVSVVFLTQEMLNFRMSCCLPTWWLTRTHQLVHTESKDLGINPWGFYLEKFHFPCSKSYWHLCPELKHQWNEVASWRSMDGRVTWIQK